MLDIRFIKKEKINKDLERYIYGYKVNLYAEEGIIDNIYDKKAKVFWGYDVIQPLKNQNHFTKRTINILEKNAVDKTGFRKVYRLID